MKPFVSIIIPNYNKADYIAQTLDSLQAQSCKEWEAVIVDDGSTDDSIKIIKQYAQKDPRFRLIERNREPKGGSVCRNIGLENALGEYVIYLDSDDLLANDALKHRLEMFSSYADNDFLVFPTGTFKKVPGDNKSVWRAHKEKHLQHFLLHRLSWHTTSPIWKRAFLFQLNGFDEAFPRLQDVELHTRALMVEGVAYKVFREVEPDSYYRIDEKRLVSSYPKFMERWVQGVCMYVEKMSKEITSKKHLNTQIHLNYLKGTVISMVTQLLYHQKQGNIDAKQRDALMGILLYNKSIQKILSSFDLTFIQIYRKLYILGLYKMKGFNYLFCKIILKV